MTDAPEPRPTEPRLAFANVDDLDWIDVVAQRHPDGRIAGAHLKFLEWTDDRLVALTRYDPHLVLERHGHASDHLIYILEGHLDVGDRPCPPGTLVVLEHGATFGPLVAGPEGTLLLESYAGDPFPASADPEGYERLLAERGIEKLPNPPFEPPAHLSRRSRYGTGDGWG
jgi:hypothetical protein